MRQALHEQVIAQGGASRQQRLSRLVRFMFHPDGLGMRYRHDADFTVAEAWQTREGNCLSFTLMTIALARAAGLDAYGQEINRTLSWYSEGDTLYFSNHVNAGIRIHQQRYSVDVASDNVLTGEPPKQVRDDRLLAILHSNRAASLLGKGRLAEAAAYMASALRADRGYASAWNNAGVLALREGSPELAEQHFLKALELDGAHDGAMLNLASLYATRGDRQREHEYRRRIEKARQRNPFHYFMLALDDEKQGDYAAAAQHYRRAIGLYDGEHRFHYGLARAYLHLGEFRKAGDALRRAQSLATEGTSERYQAKLDRLRRKGL
ncbi:tetratricopeptide repeat protein [Luteimonas saliphila]|uniref:tetratricopeptide repeat protein n=1 Tax=Luteimonas saliphila TaxID=2804919 RepID=UPI001EE2D7D0|nr:tetratricopeptide repeat protein [Luteimonas saliphila]